MLEIQGHRGARGLAPENTLAGFEIALDAGVTSIETDVHLTRDDVAVLFHDAGIAEPLCILARPEAPPVHLHVGQTFLSAEAPVAAAGRQECLPHVAMHSHPLVRSLTFDEVRCYRVHGPTHGPTPVADRFAAERGIDPHGIPSLAELFALVGEYATAPEKSGGQQARARRLIFDIELKRVPYQPETIGDGFTGDKPGTLEHKVVDAIRTAGVLERSRVRSFDHRAVLAIKQLEPALATGLLVHNTCPANIAHLLADTKADFYCPDFQFLDGPAVRQVIDAGKRVIPYTVNEPADWERLIAFGVHGITTDVPDRLARWLP